MGTFSGVGLECTVIAINVVIGLSNPFSAWGSTNTGR